MKYVLVNPAIDPKTGKDSGFIECIGVYKKDPYGSAYTPCNSGHCVYPRCKTREPGQKGCEHFQKAKAK